MVVNFARPVQNFNGLTAVAAQRYPYDVSAPAAQLQNQLGYPKAGISLVASTQASTGASTGSKNP